jgi:Nuclease-related domain
MWIIIGIISLLVLFVLYQEFQENKLLETVTNRSRGTKTERKLVLKLLKYGIPAQTIFHDLYVKLPNGKFSQIDLVVPTKVGIFVFEVKKYSGWIFGSGHHSQWTQVLAYGRNKYRFYNPIMQNSKHISDLKGQLKQFETVPFYSIIVFYGNCELKGISNVPGETFIIYSRTVREVLDTLLNTREPARYTNKHDIVRVLKEAVDNGENRDVRIQHVQHIREMLGKKRQNY